MKNNLLRKISILSALSITAAAPFLVYAAACNNALCNPTGAPDFQTFIANVLKAVVQVSLPILTLFIVYSGFMFVTARGNSEKLSKARTNFVYVILGAILILGAWVLATLIASTATQVLGSS